MKLAVVLLTYNRLAYAQETLRSTIDNLRLGDIELWAHIASDGDTSEYINSLRELAGGYAHVRSVTHTNSERGGYGKNYNLAMQVAHAGCDYVLPLEDDWRLERPLDVSVIIDAMNALDIGCMRLGYLGFTQELRGSFYTHDGRYWIKLDPDSPEPHVFAGHPRIETREWARHVGPWPEGLKPGETEFSVAHRVEARRRVGWPIDLVALRGDLFSHIGAERSWE